MVFFLLWLYLRGSIKETYNQIFHTAALWTTYIFWLIALFSFFLALSLASWDTIVSAGLPCLFCLAIIAVIDHQICRRCQQHRSSLLPMSINPALKTHHRWFVDFRPAPDLPLFEDKTIAVCRAYFDPTTDFNRSDQKSTLRTCCRATKSVITLVAAIYALICNNSVAIAAYLSTITTANNHFSSCTCWVFRHRLCYPLSEFVVPCVSVMPELPLPNLAVVWNQIYRGSILPPTCSVRPYCRHQWSTPLIRLVHFDSVAYYLMLIVNTTEHCYLHRTYRWICRH